MRERTFEMLLCFSGVSRLYEITLALAHLPKILSIMNYLSFAFCNTIRSFQNRCILLCKRSLISVEYKFLSGKCFKFMKKLVLLNTVKGFDELEFMVLYILSLLSVVCIFQDCLAGFEFSHFSIFIWFDLIFSYMESLVVHVCVASTKWLYELFTTLNLFLHS